MQQGHKRSFFRKLSTRSHWFYLNHLIYEPWFPIINHGRNKIDMLYVSLQKNRLVLTLMLEREIEFSCVNAFWSHGSLTKW